MQVADYRHSRQFAVHNIFHHSYPRTQYTIRLCDCESIEHQITLRKDNELKKIYMTIHLKPFPWYKRIANGIKYIFGYRCAYGDFDEFILSHKHADTLRKMADFLSK